MGAHGGAAAAASTEGRAGGGRSPVPFRAWCIPPMPLYSSSTRSGAIPRQPAPGPALPPASPSSARLVPPLFRSHLPSLLRNSGSARPRPLRSPGAAAEFGIAVDCSLNPKGSFSSEDEATRWPSWSCCPRGAVGLMVTSSSVHPPGSEASGEEPAPHHGSLWGGLLAGAAMKSPTLLPRLRPWATSGCPAGTGGPARP